MVPVGEEAACIIIWSMVPYKFAPAGPLAKSTTMGEVTAVKIWTISDLHVDYSENFHWVTQLSAYDHTSDLLIIAGDITDVPTLFDRTLRELTGKFHSVLFLPGNHDLWTQRQAGGSSFEKFHQTLQRAVDFGAFTEPIKRGATWFVPLHGWYDYSFGEPSDELTKIWNDFRMCKWPEGMEPKAITDYFSALNTPHLSLAGEQILTFSHFLPRTDLIPGFVPKKVKALFPVMGTTVLEAQIRILRPGIHIYGHSHFNRDVVHNGIRYINNAFGYPHETRISDKRLRCLGEA